MSNTTELVPSKAQALRLSVGSRDAQGFRHLYPIGPGTMASTSGGPAAPPWLDLYPYLAAQPLRRTQQADGVTR